MSTDYIRLTEKVAKYWEQKKAKSSASFTKERFQRRSPARRWNRNHYRYHHYQDIQCCKLCQRSLHASQRVHHCRRGIDFVFQSFTRRNMKWTLWVTRTRIRSKSCRRRLNDNAVGFVELTRACYSARISTCSACRLIWFVATSRRTVEAFRMRLRRLLRIRRMRRRAAALIFEWTRDSVRGQT